MSKNKNRNQKGSKYFGNSQRRAHNAPRRDTPTLSSHKGTLQITRSGMGFVILDSDSEGSDVLVRPQDFNSAMNGDKVIVDIKKENQATGKRDGKIVKIVQRKQTEFIGTIQISPNFAFFIPDGNKGLPDFYIPLNKINDAKNNDKVIARLVKWPEGERKPIGEVISTISQEDLNDIAMKSLLMENGFHVKFDDEILNEANALSDKIEASEVKKRKDFRKVTTFTIDPNDSKDFDDAISLKKLKNGTFEIGVHIADVSHYVKPGTALDEEAYKRATSVYLPDRVDPMLPERISNFLCSLRPNEDKYTFSAVFNIDLKGKISKTWIGKTIIHSDKRFTYDEVQEIIKGNDGPYKEEILTVNTISQALRDKRFEHGAINFSSQEIRFQLDEKGLPIGIVVNESNESHHLIEELMLLANKAVAELAQKTKVNGEPIPFPYRIHDQPDELKLTPFIALAKKFGYPFDTSTPEKIASSFNKMLTSLAGKPEEAMLQQLGIRTMAKAAYSPENIGHYGLGFKDYCHFTSPIRRYPDVMVHRVIEEILAGRKEVDEKMSLKCKHCSERERASLECERAANKYKQVEYMQQFLGEELEGIISGVSAFGFWVETLESKCEGLVSIKDLSDFDDFSLIEEDYALVGLRSGRRFRMGDHVWIKVVATNLEKRQIDYQWLPNANTNAEPAISNKITPLKNGSKNKNTKQISNDLPSLINSNNMKKDKAPKKEVVAKKPASNKKETSSKSKPTEVKPISKKTTTTKSIAKPKVEKTKPSSIKTKAEMVKEVAKPSKKAESKIVATKKQAPVVKKAAEKPVKAAKEKTKIGKSAPAVKTSKKVETVKVSTKKTTVPAIKKVEKSATKTPIGISKTVKSTPEVKPTKKGAKTETTKTPSKKIVSTAPKKVATPVKKTAKPATKKTSKK